MLTCSLTNIDVLPCQEFIHRLVLLADTHSKRGAVVDWSKLERPLHRHRDISRITSRE